MVFVSTDQWSECTDINREHLNSASTEHRKDKQSQGIRIANESRCESRKRRNINLSTSGSLLEAAHSNQAAANTS